MDSKKFRITAAILGAASLVSLGGVVSAQSVYPPVVVTTVAPTTVAPVVIVIQPPTPTFAPVTTVAPVVTTAAPTTVAPAATAGPATTAAPVTTAAPATTIPTQVQGAAEVNVEKVGANGELAAGTKTSLDAIIAAAKASGQTTLDLTAVGIDPTDTATINAIVAYLQKALPGVKINVLGIKVSRTANSGTEAAPAQAVDGNPSYTG